MPGRDGQRGDDNQKEARARRNARRDAAAKRAADAKAAELEAAKAPKAAPVEKNLAQKVQKANALTPLAKPPGPGTLGRVGNTLVGAINRSSGDTGRSSLNPAAVLRASQRGTTIGNIVSSIDKSRPRSRAGGIVKSKGLGKSSKIVDTSGL